MTARARIGDRFIVANGPFRWSAVVIGVHSDERAGDFYTVRTYSRKRGWVPEIMTGPWTKEAFFSVNGGGVAYPAKTAPEWVKQRPTVRYA